MYTIEPQNTIPYKTEKGQNAINSVIFSDPLSFVTVISTAESCWWWFVLSCLPVCLSVLFIIIQVVHVLICFQTWWDVLCQSSCLKCISSDNITGLCLTKCMSLIFLWDSAIHEHGTVHSYNMQVLCPVHIAGAKVICTTEIVTATDKFSLIC